MIHGRSENVGALSALVAQFSNELAAEKKAVRRVDLDGLEDDAEEEVCCTFTFPLVLDFNVILCLIEKIRGIGSWLASR